MSNHFFNKIIAFGGGKGGVGKSFMTSNIGTMLAQSGKKVILIDADLGGANLHSSVGIPHPSHTLNDFIKKRVDSIQDVILPTKIPNLSIICGASDILSLSNPKYTQKMKLIRSINTLEADYILLDLGAGTYPNVIDFFIISPVGVVVIEPGISSFENAYGFIKSCVYRNIVALVKSNKELAQTIGEGTDPRSEKTFKSVQELIAYVHDADPVLSKKCIEWLNTFKPFLISNKMERGQKDSHTGGFIKIVEKYLSVEIEFLGRIWRSNELHKYANTMLPICQQSAKLSSEMGLHTLGQSVNSKMLK
ncbi:MAG: AAA family ATPase [Fibrobacterales bacterium]